MEFKKILLMIPTYRRKNRLQKLIDSALKYSYDVNNIRFCFCVNVSDKETQNYLAERYFPLGDGQFEIILEKTRQPNLSKYFNMMYDETRFDDPDTLVSELGDDMYFKTQDWDKKILDVMNAGDGYNIVYCNDNFIAYDQCCVNLFTSRKLVSATNRPFMCPLFKADMVDVVWTLVGQYTGLLRYLPDVIIQHEHDSGKKATERDETFNRLGPVRKAANAGDNHKIAKFYSVLTAKDLILKGVGQWKNS